VVGHHLAIVNLAAEFFLTILGNKRQSNNFSLGCIIISSLIHQTHNIHHPSYTQKGDRPRAMTPHTYQILAFRTKTFDFGQDAIFPCSKVALRKGLSQHPKKKIGPRFEHLDTYNNNIDQNTPNNT
jgi:hypothetical protein